MSAYWYSIVGLIVGVILMYGFYKIAKGNDIKKKKYGWLIFGPFWPALNRSIEKHDGLTKREIIGWLIVLILMISVLILERILSIILGN